MSTTMLARNSTGAWEQLTAVDGLPDDGLMAALGDDLGPVLGLPEPLFVVADSPRLTSGSPAAICVDASGTVTIVTSAVGRLAIASLTELLAHAGALHGMPYVQFESLCALPAASGKSLSSYVKSRTSSPDFHAATWEVTVSDALERGHICLMALVEAAPDTLVQSLRFLNAGGAAQACCWRLRMFAGETVMAARVEEIDVGHHSTTTSIRMSRQALVAITQRQCDDQTGHLLDQLSVWCEQAFAQVAYSGDQASASMEAFVSDDAGRSPLLTAGSDGVVTISFEALAPLDGDWTIRAGLAHGLSRMLGADLGDTRKISRLNLSISEHLMDATLMEAACEIFADALAALRVDFGAPSSNGHLAAAV